MNKSLNKLHHIYELDYPIDNWDSVGWDCVFDMSGKLKPLSKELAKLAFEAIYKLSELGEELNIREDGPPAQPYDIHISNFHGFQMVGIKLDENGRTLIFASRAILEEIEEWGCSIFNRWSEYFECNKEVNFTKIS